MAGITQVLLVRNSFGIDYFTKLLDDKQTANLVYDAYEPSGIPFTFCNSWGQNTTITITASIQAVPDYFFHIGWNTSYHYENLVRTAEAMLIHVTPCVSFEESLKEIKYCVKLLRDIHDHYDSDFELSTFPLVILISQNELAKELPEEAIDFAKQINSQIFLLPEEADDGYMESFIYLLHRIPKINIKPEKEKKECAIN